MCHLARCMLAVAALHVAAILPATGQEARDSTSPLARRVGNWMVVEANKAGDDRTAVLALGVPRTPGERSRSPSDAAVRAWQG